jgi:hypothetical protein
MNILIIGILINTFLFGIMAFTDPKMGVSSLVPKILKNTRVGLIFTISYILSFLIILFSGGNLIINILVCLVMQFVINHIMWGLITGIIAGKITKNNLNKNNN